MSKLAKFAQGHYIMCIPASFSGAWTAEQWINHIDETGYWL